MVARVPQIAEEQALVDLAQNGIEIAELNLSHTVVSLPFDGWVTTGNVQVGQVVGSTMPIAQVFAKDAVEVEARISQEDVNALRPIMDARRGSPLAGLAARYSMSPCSESHRWSIPKAAWLRCT